MKKICLSIEEFSANLKNYSTLSFSKEKYQNLNKFLKSLDFKFAENQSLFIRKIGLDFFVQYDHNPFNSSHIILKINNLPHWLYVYTCWYHTASWDDLKKPKFKFALKKLNSISKEELVLLLINELEEIREFAQLKLLNKL